MNRIKCDCKGDVLYESIVRKDNAGKSTIVDGLRLISLASSRFLKLGIHDPPAWSSLARRKSGVSPSTEGMEFKTTNIFHRLTFLERDSREDACRAVS